MNEFILQPNVYKTGPRNNLLSLLEEVCTHVLIMKQGRRIAVGTLPEVVAQFSSGESGVSLEEVFIRATGGSET